MLDTESTSCRTGVGLIVCPLFCCLSLFTFLYLDPCGYKQINTNHHHWNKKVWNSKAISCKWLIRLCRLPIYFTVRILSMFKGWKHNRSPTIWTDNIMTGKMADCVLFDVAKVSTSITRFVIMEIGFKVWHKVSDLRVNSWLDRFKCSAVTVSVKPKHNGNYYYRFQDFVQCLQFRREEGGD